MSMNSTAQLRGKARMVIDYRQLNSKTIDDAYKVPNKLALLNKARFEKSFLSLISSYDFGRLG